MKVDDEKQIENTLQIKSIVLEDEIQNIVLGEIQNGKIQSARHILMTKKGMSLEQAISCIENIEKEYIEHISNNNPTRGRQ